MIMSGKTNLVILVFGIVITVAAARSLDLRDFNGAPQEPNEQNFEDLVNEVPNSPSRTISQRIKDELMAKLLDLLGKVGDNAGPYEYIPPMNTRPEFSDDDAARFEEGNLSKRSKSRYNNRWCNLVDIWKGQGGSNHRCR
ncbi:uncharacterized protein [Apostichopus japonicus]|uniref:uncharacterized protein n=1 Tax=Stichopus japonicus TaxID=307972 RepID=UPI003AB60E2F